MEHVWTEQKKREATILEFARQVNHTIPKGTILPFEEPDLIIQGESKQLAIEITELHPPENEFGFAPKKTADLHRKAVKQAEELYRSWGAPPAKVVTYFESDDHWPLQDPEGYKRFLQIKTRPEYMARSLAEFVREKFKGGEETLHFGKRGEVPLGFANMSIFPSKDSWFGGECRGDVLRRDHIAERVRNKQEKLANYRRNFPDGEIWLLIYNGVAVSESLGIPVSFEEWSFNFDFERVLLVAALEREVFELRRRN